MTTNSLPCNLFAIYRAFFFVIDQNQSAQREFNFLCGFTTAKKTVPLCAVLKNNCFFVPSKTLFCIYLFVRQFRVFPVLTYIENTIHPLLRPDVSPDFTTDFYYIKIISILYNNFQNSFIKLIKILIKAKSETFFLQNISLFYKNHTLMFLFPVSLKNISMERTLVTVNTVE